MASAPQDEQLAEERAAILPPCTSTALSSRESAGSGDFGAARKLEGSIKRVFAAGTTLLALALLVSLAAWWAAAGGRRRTKAGFMEATTLVKADVQLPPQPFAVGGMSPPVGTGTPKSLLAESLLSALGARAEKVAPTMSASDVASTLGAYVHLDAHPSPDLLSALTRRAKVVVPDMIAADVAKTLNAFSRMREHPGRDLWDSLEQRAQEVAGDLGPQDVADMITAFEFLGVQPTKPLMDAMRLRATQLAPKMGVQAVAETVESAAKMRMKGDALWAALGHRARRAAKHFSAQELANTLEAYSALGKQPPKPLWTALGRRATQAAPRMGVKDITHVLKAYAGAYEVLRRKPGDDMLVALGNRAEQMVDHMSSEDVAAMLSSYAQLSRLAKLHRGSAVEALPAERKRQGKALPKESSRAGGAAHEKAGEGAADSQEEVEVIEDEAHLEAAEKAGNSQAFPLPSGVVLSPQ